MVAHNCGCDCLGKWGKRVIWTQKFKPPWAMLHNPVSTNNHQTNGQMNKGIDGRNESGASQKWKVWIECERTLRPTVIVRSVLTRTQCDCWVALYYHSQRPRPGWWHFEKALIKLPCLGIVSRDRSCPLAFTRVHLPNLHPFLFLF